MDNYTGLTGVTGCHSIKARYVLTSDCGPIAAGTPSADPVCGESNEVEFVIYPEAPVITASSTCASNFVGPTLTAYPGFTAEYSLDGGAWTTTPVMTGITGCHTIKARYVLTSDCGPILAGTPSADPACGESNEVEFVIYPEAPVITASSTCASNFVGPTLTAYPGFTAEYSLDGGAWTTTPVMTGITGCHTIKARYVLTNDCGPIAAGTPSADPACGESNEVEFVIYPEAPVITASSTCASNFVGPTLPAYPGFTAEYSLDGGGMDNNPCYDRDYRLPYHQGTLCTDQ